MFGKTTVVDAECLLKKNSENTTSLEITRSHCKYSSHSDRFKVKDKSFVHQYADLYALRLSMMRKKLIHAAKEKWGDDIEVCHLCDLKPGTNHIVVGTVFKDMQLRPSILKEISDEHNIVPQPFGSRFSDDSDKLIIEDELQRIVLQGSIDVHSLVTGVVIAVYGHEPEDNTGKFIVRDYCWQILPSQVPRNIVENDSYIVFLSGLEIGNQDEDQFQMQMLVDILTGQLGSPNQQMDVAQIVATVIAGNCLSQSTQDKEVFTKAKYLTKNTLAGSLGAMKTLDDLMVQLASNMNVYLMPGEFDPCNHFLPQQPLHKCMFPRAGRYSTFISVTNPHEFSLNGLRILGSSGQPVNDIRSYSKLDECNHILEQTLQWGHMAPTAPDSLACFPFYNHDPFIIDSCPHVYFAGNQLQYQTQLYNGSNRQVVRLISIPKFSMTGTCVLLNIKTLDCIPLVVGPSFGNKDIDIVDS